MSIPVIIGVVTVLIVAVVLWSLRASSAVHHRTGRKGDFPDFARTLCLMQEGSHLVVQMGHELFIQFLRIDSEEDTALMFDFPATGSNAAKFDEVLNAMAEGGFSTRVDRAEVADSSTITVLQVEFAGSVAAVVDHTTRVFELLLPTLGCNPEEEFGFELAGELDVDARMREGIDALEALADSGVPVLSRLARRQVAKLGRRPKTQR